MKPMAWKASPGHLQQSDGCRQQRIDGGGFRRGPTRQRSLHMHRDVAKLLIASRPAGPKWPLALITCTTGRSTLSSMRPPHRCSHASETSSVVIATCKLLQKQSESASSARTQHCYGLDFLILINTIQPSRAPTPMLLQSPLKLVGRLLALYGEPARDAPRRCLYDCCHAMRC